MLSSLQLLLFEAERAWAYAQELTNSALQPANQENASSLRHSATGRFRRAVNWSTQLLSLCQTLYGLSRLSAENLLEVTIYTVILNGRFLRYRDDFEDALIQLSVAKSLLDDLANASSTSRDQALAVLCADEIGPEIRYCAHELGRTKAYDINGIVSELAPVHRNEIVENCDTIVAKLQSEEGSTTLKSQLKERLWEDQPVPIRYPELVDVFLKVEQAEAIVDSGRKEGRRSTSNRKAKSDVTAYDAVLAALSDAEEVARKLQEAQQVTGTTSTSSNGGRDIQFVHAYIVYQLLSRRIQRDLLLINTLLASDKTATSQKPAQGRATADSVDKRLHPAIVKLLDTILQSLTQMRTISIVDDNPDLASAVDARLAFTNSRRCVYLAQCYAAVKKYGEALALLQHATIHVREAVSSVSLSESDLINSGNASFFPLSAEDITEVETTITSDSLQLKRDWFAYNGGSVKADPTTYKKPLFFNIALNYVELDMDRLQQRAGKQSVPAPVASRSSTQASQTRTEFVPEKKPTPKAKAEEHVKPTPEPQPQARGGLSSLLGGWWNKGY